MSYKFIQNNDNQYPSAPITYQYPRQENNSLVNDTTNTVSKNTEKSTDDEKKKYGIEGVFPVDKENTNNIKSIVRLGIDLIENNIIPC